MRKRKKVGTPKLRAKAKRLKYKHNGQSKGVGFPKGYYVKGGILHKTSVTRDRARKAKTVRKRGTSSWRGDLRGRRV